jgi:hypothetical protein
LSLLRSAPSIKEKEQRLVGSESGKCVRVGRHVYPWTVVLVLLKILNKYRYQLYLLSWCTLLYSTYCHLERFTWIFIEWLSNCFLMPTQQFSISYIEENCISSVMVSVLSLSVIDRGFKPWSGQTKDYKNGICCFSTMCAALRRKSKDWLARNQVIE